MRREVINSMRHGALAASLGALMLFVAAGAAFAEGGTGTATIGPSGDVAAGALGTWTIRYTAAEAFSSGTIAVVIPDGWSAPQISASSSAGYVTVSSEGVLGASPLTIAGTTIIVSIDTLDAGQTVDIVYGDATAGLGGRAAAQTGAQSGVEFVVSSDSNGPGHSPIASSPLLDVVAGPVARLSFITSPQTFPADGESAVIRVRTEDQFGNPAAVSGDQDILLSSTAPSGRFSRLGGSNFVETSVVVVASGLDTVSLYYRDTVAGGKTITRFRFRPIMDKRPAGDHRRSRRSFQTRGVSRRYDGHRGGFCEVPARGRGRGGEREPAPQRPGNIASRSAGGFLFDGRPCDADYDRRHSERLRSCISRLPEHGQGDDDPRRSRVPRRERCLSHPRGRVGADLHR